VVFIAWDGNMSHHLPGISRWDAYRQYLACDEGQGGYQRKTCAKKPWLPKVAREVINRVRRYQTLLAQCEDELNSGWHLWPF
jgi:hypothetical protein